MLFHSWTFLLLFLPLTLAAFHSTARLTARSWSLGVLLVSSLWFYGSWNPPYLLLLLGSIAGNLALGEIAARRASVRVLGLAVGLNLAVIGYFKYAAFLMGNLSVVVGANLPVPVIVLPLGISFFTFQQIAWLVDRYRGRIGPVSPLRYTLFVAFFPQLIAGPIIHAAKILPQFDKPRLQLNPRDLAAGIALFTIGLWKKAFVADSFAPMVSPVYDLPGEPTAIAAWAATLAYTLQIYFDFSGYSDMAIGLGRMFSLDIPVNFDAPYRATSMIDFWRRWHMTLSAFLRDYLYVPLGGNRHSSARRYLNLMVTMVLGGLWHGASWTFVAWGTLHGLYLIANHGLRGLGLKIPAVIGWSCTFLCVMLGWVLFRAERWDRALAVFAGMAGRYGLGAPGGSEWMLGLGLIVCLGLPVSWRWVSRTFDGDAVPRIEVAVGLSALLLSALMGLGRIDAFLYFQF